MQQNTTLQTQISKLHETIKSLKEENSSLHHTLSIGNRPLTLRKYSIKLEQGFKIGNKHFETDSIISLKRSHISNTFLLLQVKMSEPEKAPKNPANRTTFKIALGSPLSSFSRITSNSTKIFGKDVFFVKNCKITNNNTNSSVRIDTISLTRPKTNHVTPISPLKSENTLKSFFQQLERVKPETHLLYL